MTGGEVLELSQTIQLVVAPAFLLTAFLAGLNLMSTRLGRIVDRLRALTVLSAHPDHRSPRERREERETLGRRRRLINRAIASATLSATLICITIILAFLGFIIQLRMPDLIAGLFIASMASFVAALVCLLGEVLASARRPDLGPPPSHGEDSREIE